MSISNYLEAALLNHVLRNSAYTSPTTVYLSCHTANPAETGANEVTGGSYARQAIAFDAPVGNVVSNSAQIEFTGMPATTVTHLALWDAASAGNCLWDGAMAASRTLEAGDTLRFAAGTVDVDLD